MVPKNIPFLPHPPEFLSCFAEKKERAEAQESMDSYRKLLKETLKEKPSTLLIVQSHGGIHPEGITFHVPDGQQYEADYAPYGHPEKSFTAVFDQSLAHFIQKSLHEYGRNTHVLEQSKLSLPALLVADICQELKVPLPRMLVMGVSLEGAQAHYEYGSLISRALAADKDPIAVVLTGQLSHCLTKESVAGYVPIAKNYDKQIQNYLTKSDWNSLMHMDPFEIQEVGEDAYRPLMIGLGIFDALQGQIKWEASTYEAPQGIGYLSGLFKRD